MISLAWDSLRFRPLRALLNVTTMAMGIALITVVLIVSKSFSDRLSRDAENIDLVVGGEGSKLQLVLSSVYHLDIPNPNIKLSAAMEICNNRLISKAAPIGMGDSFAGFPIIGTTREFFELYSIPLKSMGTFKAVVGYEAARTGRLQEGDAFYGSHGIIQSAGSGSTTSLAQHKESSYKVTQVLPRQNSIIDRLIVTDIRSIWQAHDHSHVFSEGQIKEDDHHHHSSHNEQHGHEDCNHPDHISGSAEAVSLNDLREEENFEDLEITALLITYANSRGHAVLPKLIQKMPNVQAASSSVVITRFLKMFGMGKQLIYFLGGFLLLMAGLSILGGLLNHSLDRKKDLALMRSLGATRRQLFSLIIFEGLIVSLLGMLLGLFIGHGFTEMLGNLIWQGRTLGLHFFSFSPAEFYLVLFVLISSILASAIPAKIVYNIEPIRELEK